MKQFTTSNLPERSVPWAREVEAAINERDTVVDGLVRDLAVANRTIDTMTNQMQTLQNYIRTMCELQGLSYPPAAAPPAPPPDVVVPPSATSKTIEVGSIWSGTWYQGFKRNSPGGTNDDSQSLYQRGTGYTFSMVGFDMGDAAGKKITKAELYLSNISTYYNGPFVAVLGTHGHGAEPANRQDRQNPFDVGWTAGEAKYVTIPEVLLPGLSNGSIRGFSLGDNISDRQNFARFNGHNRYGAPRLRLTFEV